MKNTIKNGKLGILGAGSRFTYGGVEWLVLDARPNMSLCLAADVLKDEDGDVRFIPFDTENKNDFAASSLRAWLNEDFLNELAVEGADKEAFLNITLDLTSDDGLDDYKTDTGKIGLITCEMYRQFRKLIPNASDWWWTCTPFSTAKNGDSYYVRGVHSSGALGNGSAYSGHFGVRPLCVLKSDILVSYDEEQKTERQPSLGEMIARGLAEGLRGMLGADEEEKAEAAPQQNDDAEHRTQAEDMMKHISAAFNIPVAFLEKQEEEANTLYNQYSTFIKAGFTTDQAWEIFKTIMRRNS